MSWNLSWQPDDRCNSFTKESILAYAPPSSGVYGLFNFDCQIFIGESSNIREALLRHETETDFQSQHLRPTGFTFEPCAAELRKTKADELIARFRPVLETGAVLAENGSPSRSPIASETDQRDQELETFFDHQEFPAQKHEESTKVRRGFQLKRARGVLLLAISIAAAVIFYFGMPADYALQKRASGANPTPGSTDNGLIPHSASTSTASRPANQRTERTSEKTDVHTSSARTAVDRRGLQTKTGSTVAASANSSKKWSVQIAAAPKKDTADTLIQQLKAKGYDGYVVPAEVKGQIYYRVRVGHFDSREQAESVRQSLVRQVGYQDAYLAAD